MLNSMKLKSLNEGLWYLITFLEVALLLTSEAGYFFVDLIVDVQS